jgi:hypothetical protein
VNTEPVTLALQHVRETRALLEGLITSSESFDYHRAKDALKALQKKARELAKVEAEMMAELPTPTELKVLQFPLELKG